MAGAGSGWTTCWSAAGEGAAIELAALGIAMRVRLPSAASGGQLCVIDERTAPGHGPPLHIHHHQAELFRVIAGRYRFRIGEAEFTAEAGAVALVPPGVPHAFRNLGDADAALQFALMPALEAETFFAELTAILAGGPPTPERLTPLRERFGFEVVGPPLPG